VLAQRQGWIGGSSASSSCVLSRDNGHTNRPTEQAAVCCVVVVVVVVCCCHGSKAVYCSVVLARLKWMAVDSLVPEE